MVYRHKSGIISITWILLMRTVTKGDRLLLSNEKTRGVRTFAPISFNRAANVSLIGRSTRIKSRVRGYYESQTVTRATVLQLLKRSSTLRGLGRVLFFQVPFVLGLGNFATIATRSRIFPSPVEHFFFTFFLSVRLNFPVFFFEILLRFLSRNRGCIFFQNFTYQTGASVPGQRLWIPRNTRQL